MLTSRSLAIAVLALAGSGGGHSAPGPATIEIPHRTANLEIDGDASDWGSEAARFEIRRPATEGEPAARAAARLVWDRRALWVLLEVVDPTLHLAPPSIAGPELFQWDSVEIYLDGRGDRSRRMGADDFQFLLAPDGRYSVLQGDPLLLELEELEVPKRERESLVVEVAAARDPDGYRIECAIPFAAVGIAPRDGATIAIDLALNDWLADHPPLQQVRFDLDTVRKLDARPANEPSAYTDNGLAAELAAELERRLYRPWSLAGSRDFGHPQRWTLVRLTGGPAFAEQVVETLGPRRTLVGAALFAAVLVALGVIADEWHHRRRIAVLLGRLATLEAMPPPAREGVAEGAATGAGGAARARPPASRPEPLDYLERSAERAEDSGAHARLELRALKAILDRLDQPLSPAELSDQLFVSLRTLQRHLTGALACSPGELILAVKMREARRLLERGGLQVQEVARRVGYDDPAHFSRRFKAYHGASPTAIGAGREQAA